MPSQSLSNSYLGKISPAPFKAEYHIKWYDVSLCSVWASWPGYATSQPLVHLQPTHWVAEENRARKREDPASAI